MTGLLFTSLLALLAVEYFCRLPFVSHVRTLTGIANKAGHVIISKKISDHWKEIVLLRYAWELATHTAFVALMLFGCVVLVVLPALFLDRLFGFETSILESFSTWSGLSSITVVSFLYIILRKRMKTTDYSFADRLLHHLALGMPVIRKVSFELNGFFSRQGTKDHLNERHVFVSGLARAGTTIFMRTLFDTGQFRSLTYRDMPFVLMPGTWKKISNFFYKQEKAKERAHGDGIHVDFDSPEAFEEIFWQTFSGDDYIFDNCLQPYSVSNDLIEQFRLYVQSIIASSDNRHQRRYLSKNNNNILRLDAIRKAFPKSLIIILFRDPLQQAISLLNQHKKFCDLHSNDQFSYDYMRWLGHHEFGMTHKPFQFKKQPCSFLTDYATDNINYWLGIWINVNSYLLRNAPPDSIFVCFEDLCVSPAETLKSLSESTDILFDEDKLNRTFKAPPTKDADSIDESMKNSAEEIYQELKMRRA